MATTAVDEGPGGKRKKKEARFERKARKEKKEERARNRKRE